jgi:hypothetical protein
MIATLLLAALSLIMFLAVVVFLGEPPRLGRPAAHFHAADLAYLAVPLVLLAAAAAVPLRVLLRERRREQT